MAHEPVTFDPLPISEEEQVICTTSIIEHNHAHPSTVQTNTQPWGFAGLKTEISLRGGGCASSLLCERIADAGEDDNFSTGLNAPSKGTTTNAKQEQDEVDVAANAQTNSLTWRGWAELENDPEIFTILLQEWGVPTLQVQEIIDIAELITASPDETLGLIFLSRYVAPDTGSTIAAESLNEHVAQPWFANQISKFSCGTVALMNILMNSQNTSLSETLCNFRMSTSTFSAKDRGIAIDENVKFREIHNSFSTKMDRMIVDVLLKEDAQKYKTRKAAEARQAKQVQRNGKGQKKRKRAGFTTKRKKKSSVVDEEEDNGFHFVAFVPANGAVWKMDGLQAHPDCLGKMNVEQTWLNIAAKDLMEKMQEAFSSGQDCSLMSISKMNTPVAVASTAESSRKQEDWAPFIEHMLRLHAEKGDLQDLLGL